MEQQIRFCTTSDGVRIAYATVGEGPPLVLVPGWVSHLELIWEYPPWREMFEHLAEHALLVRYDKRGTGLSDRQVGDYTIEARESDLAAVIDQLGFEQCALYGVSEGGPVATAYAAHHPERVSHLILYGTYARMRPSETTRALVALVRAEWGLGSRTLSNLFLPGASQDEVEWFVKLQNEGAGRADAADMLQANIDTDVQDLLPQVQAPTLVIHARGDRAVPFEWGRGLASGIPNARLVPIEGDRHLPDEGGWAQITDLIVDFLRGDKASEPDGPEASLSGPLTILFTDMESSSALRQGLGDEGAQELVRTHNAIVRGALNEHSGNEIKHTGDGIMASFASASGALGCAVAIQRSVAGHVEEHPGDPLAVYIGLNAGEPIAEEQDLFGTSVDLAKRICDQAGSGEILASDVVRQLVAGKGFLFADRGETALRGFEDPVRLYEVRWRE